jgi:integrase
LPLSSYQKGWVNPRGKKWYGYFRRTTFDPSTNGIKTVTVPVILGLRSEITKTQAREMLAREIAQLQGQITEDGTVKSGAVTFGWFVRNRYLPLKEADWREETAKVKKLIITADLVIPFEGARLDNFDKYILQRHLNKLARTHSKDRVMQIRSYVRAIFADAVDQDYLTKDPARSLKVPANLRPVDKTTLTWDQLRAALDRLLEQSLRDWILVLLDMSNALRPSELFCLRWLSLLEEPLLLDIQETFYRGKVRPFGKTEDSITKVPVAEPLVEKLLEWKDVLTDELRRKKVKLTPDTFMFPGRFGTPIDPSNFRKRVLHRLAEELGLPKLTFQVIRRTIATLAEGHVKGVQGMLRHSTVQTTQNVYMQILQPRVRETVDAVHEELSRKSKLARKPPNHAGASRAANVLLEAPAGSQGRGAERKFSGDSLHATKLQPSSRREVQLNA